MAIESGKINVKNLFIAMMKTEDTPTSKPVYDTPFQLSEATQFGRTPTAQESPAYGDGRIVENYSSSSGGNFVAGIHALSLEKYKRLYGGSMDKNGVLVSTTGDKSNYCAVMFETEKGNGQSILTVLYKAQFAQPEVQVDQKTQSVTWQQPTLSGTYTARSDFWINEEDKRVNPIFAQYDEGSPEYDPQIEKTWFSEVYEPEVVSEPIAVTEIILSKTTIPSLTQGTTEGLTVEVRPANATNKNITWKSSDITVATVTASGLIEGVVAGTAAITATSEDGGKIATCDVTVVAIGDGLKTMAAKK